jgi:hypothetical protein
MAEEMFDRNESKDTITPESRRMVILWAVSVLFLYVVAGATGVRFLEAYRIDNEKYRQAWMEGPTTQPGAPAPLVQVEPGKPTVKVVVGVFVHHIEGGLGGIKESTWNTDFDVWFRWTGEGIEPGENFQVVNGTIEAKEKAETNVAGNERYERYRVKARLAKFFDVSRFPWSKGVLSIQLEDGREAAGRLQYVADEKGSGLSPIGIPQGMVITDTLARVLLHNYGSGFSDPQLSPGATQVHSRFVFGIFGSLSSLPIYIRMFQALFVSVAAALTALFIKPIHVDPRFGLGVGALFAATANNISVGEIVPYTDQLTLTTMVNASGLATIFLSLLQSTISLYLFDTLGREKLSRFYDRVSFVVVLLGFVATNLILIIVAWR